jgi:hypothetical protein
VLSRIRGSHIVVPHLHYSTVYLYCSVLPDLNIHELICALAGARCLVDTNYQGNQGKHLAEMSAYIHSSIEGLQVMLWVNKGAQDAWPSRALHWWHHRTAAGSVQSAC